MLLVSTLQRLDSQFSGDTNYNDRQSDDSDELVACKAFSGDSKDNIEKLNSIFAA